MFDFEAWEGERMTFESDLLEKIAHQLRNDLNQYLNVKYRADEHRPYREAEVSVYGNIVELFLDDDLQGLGCHREGPGMEITVQHPDEFDVAYEIAPGMGRTEERLTKTRMMDRVIDWLAKASNFRLAGPFYIL